MEEKFDLAIYNCLAMVRANSKPEDAMKFAQAALNLAHAKSQLATIEATKPQKTKGAGAS